MTAVIGKIQIRGLNPLQGRLKNITNPEIIEEALDRCALLVEGDARRLVRVKTGALRSSINSNRYRLMRKIGSSKKYAASQEFGRPDLPHYGYTPYLRPALRMNRDNITKIIKESLEKQKR